MNLLNSPFTQQVLRFGLSKGGVLVRWIVAMAIGAMAKQNIFPEGDLKEIQLGLESGGIALLAALYGFIEWWLTHRQKDGVRAIQNALNVSDSPTPTLETDGIAGNETIQAASMALKVPVARAIAVTK